MKNLSKQIVDDVIICIENHISREKMNYKENQYTKRLENLINAGVKLENAIIEIDRMIFGEYNGKNYIFSAYYYKQVEEAEKEYHKLDALWVD